MGDEPVRHDLVAADPAAWADLLRARADLDGVPHLAGWAEAARPLIVRRRVPGEGDACVPLGLPLPPADGKRRIGLALPPDALRPVPPPTLAGTAHHAPAAWAPAIDALLALGNAHRLVPRPFGALLWQAVTGLTYLAATSDLDLLWPGPAPRTLLDGLAAIDADAPMRLDGEILLPDGGGVQWRELREAPMGGSVLVKYLDRVAMRPAATRMV
ncbi:malonate decarboxylase holo-[acyl-carrier-protein] synthase [Methylobacterium sp. J-076]|uniref:malonate decarboxylase holo-[acyl-carrier-protein] synthase n=1 Tax=Methylobacterium sp. J-076 TaxID=2836655 RepID=UPI001FBBB040|nr:malonate decarboxylase holo-[acyl-carrier-protein] synthase [Methylobacterium sp. J-076]MCJ2012379.1 malonate decarboxylase holo-[acyl-carrier-protein] synthase [Methylobacterium sp. J-076]